MVHGGSYIVLLSFVRNDFDKIHVLAFFLSGSWDNQWPPRADTHSEIHTYTYASTHYISSRTWRFTKLLKEDFSGKAPEISPRCSNRYESHETYFCVAPTSNVLFSYFFSSAEQPFQPWPGCASSLHWPWAPERELLEAQAHPDQPR